MDFHPEKVAQTRQTALKALKRAVYTERIDLEAVLAAQKQRLSDQLPNYHEIQKYLLGAGFFLETTPRDTATTKAQVLPMSPFEKEQLRLSGEVFANDRVDLHVIKVLEACLSGDTTFSDFWTIYSQDGYLLAAVTSEFLSLHCTQIVSFLEAREKSRHEFASVVQLFQDNNLDSTINSSIPIPICMLQLDDHKRVLEQLHLSVSERYLAMTNVLLGIAEKKEHKGNYIAEMLLHFPSKKATQFSLYGQKQREDSPTPPPQDYFADVETQCKRLALSFADFVYKQQQHEKNKQLTNPITQKICGTTANWFNEGAGEFLAHFHERTSLWLTELTVTDVLQILFEPKLVVRYDTDTESRFHAISHILIESIALAYDPSTSTQGFFTFTHRLLAVAEELRARNSPLNSSEELSHCVLDLLVHDEKLEAVYANISRKLNKENTFATAKEYFKTNGLTITLLPKKPQSNTRVQVISDSERVVMKRQTSDPATLAVDSHVAELLKQYVQGKHIRLCGVYNQKSELIAVCMDEFIEKHLVETVQFLTARSTVTERFNQLGAVLHSLGLIAVPVREQPAPVCLLHVDDTKKLGRILGLEHVTTPGTTSANGPDRVAQMLQERPSRKATRHLILGQSGTGNPPNDYLSYIKDMATRLGLSIEAFIFKQQLHEQMERITYGITLQIAKVTSNWFNEGAGELFAEFYERSDIWLEHITLEEVEHFLAAPQSFSRSNTESNSRFHALSHIVVLALVRLYDPQNAVLGFAELSRALLAASTAFNQLTGDEKFTAIVHRVLEDGKYLPQLQKNIAEILSSSCRVATLARV